MNAATVTFGSHGAIVELFRIRRIGRRHCGQKAERGGQAKRPKTERRAAKQDKPRRVAFAAI